MTGEWPAELQVTVDHVEAMVARLAAHPEWLALLDQDGAAVRDRLDDMGVTITHPESLLAGLAFMQLVVERVPAATQIRPVVASVRAGIIGGLLDHLPLEARR